MSNVVKKTFAQRYQDVMPKGAGALCIIQIFATLSYSVLYSTLILYMTKKLHMNDMLATSITGSFIALNYFLHLVGGYIGGRYLSNRSLFFLGMILQLAGCWLIALNNMFYLLWGLAVFLGGSGLNVTCLNCMVTQLFEPEDKRRESAFLWNYSGMNIGFFIGFGLGGYFDLGHSYQTLFLLSGIGNLFALLLVIYHWQSLKDRKTLFMEVPPARRNNRRLLGISMVVSLILVLRLLLNYTSFCNMLILAIGAVMIGLVAYLAVQQKKSVDRQKIFGFLILTVASLIFWALYQLAPMGLNLFIERNVDRHLWCIIVAPQWAQNINTVCIILGGPLLSMVFSRLRERGINISIPLQFSVSLTLIGLGFAILPIGINYANALGYTAFSWILASYILQSVGELFISPIGYAMIGQLAPIKLRGLLMGVWMMITGIAAILSDFFSKLALGHTNATNPLLTNADYSYTFNLLGWSAIIAGGILFCAIPFIARLTQEKLRNKNISCNTAVKSVS